MAAKKKATRKKATRKKKVKQPEPEHEVYVCYTYTSTSGGGICPGQEDDDWPSHEPEYKSHEVNGVFTKYQEHRGWDHYCDHIGVFFEPTPGKTVYAVAVEYQDGSTFGSTHGNVTVVDVFDEESKANDLARAIRGDTFKNSLGGTLHAWNGYFNCLEGIEVHRFKIDESEYPTRF
jgi:hypothetical protein